MNNLFKTEKIEEYQHGANISFLINNKDFFSITDYKVMKGQTEVQLIDCKKLIYNGKLKLIYFTEYYKKLGQIIQNISPRLINYIILDIFKNIVAAKSNGFLEVSNLLLSTDYMFVMEDTLKVYFIYLPVEAESIGLINEDTALRNLLQNILELNSDLANSIVKDVLSKLSHISLEEIYLWMSGKLNLCGLEAVYDNKQKINFPILTSVNTEVPLELCIDKDEYVIGRSREFSDGVVDISKAIGRKHCKITKINGEYYVSDLESKNGTSVNGISITANKQVKISDGMQIKIANILFKVKFSCEDKICSGH